MAPRKNTNNAIWKYFENKDEIGKAVCTLCNLVLNNNRNHNLKMHLLRQHQIDLTNLETDSSSSISKKLLLNNPKKQTIKVQINKQILFRSYIGLVTEDSLPFNVLNSPNLKNIIDPICDGLGEKLGKRLRLNEKNCKLTLKKVASNIRENIKIEMKNRLISLKIDSASRLSRHIFGISAQFIYDEDEIKSLILGMIKLKGIGASASNNLAGESLKTIKTYDVHLNQIVSITSDNGANMIKTTKILSNMSEEREIEEEALNETYISNINNLETPSNLRVEHIQVCRCAAHTAQLCTLDVTKDPQIKEFLLSCRNLTKFIRKPSNVFRDTFELRSIKLPQLDCSTRWGSTYNMVNTLLAAKDILMAVESVGNKSIDDNFDNTDFLWDFIESYVTVFAPLQATIVKFQAEHLHYGNFYAEWLKCKMLTSKIVQINDTKELLKNVGKKLLASMEKRTSKLLENESLNACLFLDPRFQHTLSFEKRQKAVTYLKHLWGKLRSVSDASQFISGDNDLTANSAAVEDEAEEMLESFLTEQLQARSGEVGYTDVYSKITNLHLSYMRSSTNVIHYWRERKHSEPELYALSNVCFGIPPTQVTIERAFSSLELILADNRNRMKHETLEDILLVKLNSTFLNEAINTLLLFEETENFED